MKVSSVAEFVKICAICGKEFISERSHSKYCSKDCQYQASKIKHGYYPKVCKNCGAQLPSNVRKYCTPCVFEYYYRTKSNGAYNALVRRGYGGRLMMEYLTEKRIKRSDNVENKNQKRRL